MNQALVLEPHLRYPALIQDDVLRVYQTERRGEPVDFVLTSEVNHISAYSLIGANKKVILYNPNYDYDVFLDALFEICELVCCDNSNVTVDNYKKQGRLKKPKGLITFDQVCNSCFRGNAGYEYLVYLIGLSTWQISNFVQVPILMALDVDASERRKIFAWVCYFIELIQEQLESESHD